ncbi:MAG: DUF4304 domain-containing protein [Gaiellaceae bacterium]
MNTNIIAKVFDNCLRTAGFKKHDGANWYRRTLDVISVVSLEKSRFAPEYYCHLGFSLSKLEHVEYPKAWDCHVDTRWEVLLEDRDVPRLVVLMDLNTEMEPAAREHDLRELIESSLIPALRHGDNLEQLATLLGTGRAGADPIAREMLEKKSG